MPRKPFVGGNWKSNGTVESSKELIAELKKGTGAYRNRVDVVVCPIAPHLSLVSKLLGRKNPIGVAAQNVSTTGEGAFTGEISAGQLKDFGINWTLVGHSERRTKYGENDAACATKIEVAQAADLGVLFCIGELLDEREKGETDAVNKRMMDAVIPKIKDWSKIVIAYEPVWAIGTGKVATPEQAQEAHEAIRKMIKEAVSEEVAEGVRILYGGSVTPDNCKTLIDKPDIDGFLVGGASLKPSFHDIIAACVPVKPLKKPQFIKVGDVEPEMKGVNLYGKVVQAPESITEGISEVVVGDATGKVTLRIRLPHSASVCEVGKTMRVQNARVVMIKGFVRLEVDKWTALKPAEEEIAEVGTKDVSAVEYEQMSS